MRILAIDVGMGTQDILAYDDSRVPENNPKMVLPAMTQILARRVESTEGDLCFTGFTMGGGPLAFAIREHLRKGYRVSMTPDAARSLRDNLGQVTEMGVDIVSEAQARKCGGERLETRDVDFPFIRGVLEGVGEDFVFDFLGVAVQDHGYAEGKSDREFRFEKFGEALEKDCKLHSMGYHTPPAHYTRMSSLARMIEEQPGRAFIVDSKIAAMAGALHGVKERPVITVDIGNGHTTAALIGRGMEVLGLFEHHTGMLKRKTLEDYLRRFAEGELTNREVFDDGGHGCYSREGVRMGRVRGILATGPKRGLLAGSDLSPAFATPMGDVMMAGPVGIVDMIRSSLS